MSGNYKEFFIYNLNTQETTVFGYTNQNHHAGSIITLAGRVFIFGAQFDPTTLEEFFASNNTWVVLQSDQLASQIHMTVISVPASWFQWLPQECVGLQ